MEFEIQDMTCAHCVGVVTRAVQTIDAQARVAVDLATKTVRIETTQPADGFIAALQDEGYSPTLR